MDYYEDKPRWFKRPGQLRGGATYLPQPEPDTIEPEMTLGAGPTIDTGYEWPSDDGSTGGKSGVDWSAHLHEFDTDFRSDSNRSIHDFVAQSVYAGGPTEKTLSTTKPPLTQSWLATQEDHFLIPTREQMHYLPGFSGHQAPQTPTDRHMPTRYSDSVGDQQVASLIDIYGF